MVDTHRLRVFRAVVQTGSINGAATRLGYTPSAVSQHVSALQRETSLTLIERRGRGIVPTAAGIVVAERAARILDQLTDFDGLADDLRNGRTGSVRIGCFTSAVRAWMPRIAAMLGDEFPQLRIDLDLVEFRGEGAFSPDVEIYVAESVRGDRDLAAAEGAADGYDIEELLTEGYVAAVPTTSELAGRASVTLPQLVGERWIDNDLAHGPCREIVVSACAAAGISPRFRLEAPDYATALDFVAAGVGVTLLPRLGARELPSGVALVPIADDAVRRRIMLRVKRSVRAHPPVRRVAALLREAARA